jgi:hypothetical protein
MQRRQITAQQVQRGDADAEVLTSPRLQLYLLQRRK